MKTHEIAILVAFLFVVGSIGHSIGKNQADSGWRVEVRAVCTKNGHTVVETSRGPVCIPKSN